MGVETYEEILHLINKIQTCATPGDGQVLFLVGAIRVGMGGGASKRGIQPVESKRPEAADIAQIEPAQAHGAATTDHEPCVWKQVLQ